MKKTRYIRTGLRDTFDGETLEVALGEYGDVAVIDERGDEQYGLKVDRRCCVILTPYASRIPVGNVHQDLKDPYRFWLTQGDHFTGRYTISDDWTRVRKMDDERQDEIVLTVLHTIPAINPIVSVAFAAIHQIVAEPVE